MGIGPFTTTLTLPATACDFCGCGGGLINPSVLPQFHNNFIGLRYSQLAFYYPEYETLDEMASVELRMRYYLTPKLQVLGVLPFRRLTRSSGVDTIGIQGLGDVNLMFQYQLIEAMDTSGIPTHHQLWVGMGGKFATGKSQGEIYEDLPAHFRLGTGTYDLQFFLNYQLQLGKLGINLQSSYQKGLTSLNEYTYGDQARTALIFFGRKTLGMSTLMPSVGIEGEWLARDVEEGFYLNQTGGKGAYATMGLDWFSMKVSIGATVRLPLAQQYASGDIQSQTRWGIRINYLF